MQKKNSKKVGVNLNKPAPSGLIMKGLSNIKPLSLAFDIEKANINVAGTHPPVKRSLHQSIWRDLSDRVRQRGSHFLSGRQWPGSVYLPSWVVQRLIERNRIRIPDSFKKMSTSDVSKIISLIAGWRQDRSVYEFSGFPLEVVRQSEVNVHLVERSFLSAPSHVLYIDLESLNIISKDHRVPNGFLVGINSVNSRLELTFCSFSGHEILLDCLDLDGSNFDEKVQYFHLKDPPGKVYRLNLMISAFLMICLDRSKISAVKDCAYAQGFAKPWSRWLIDKTENQEMEIKYQNLLSQKPSKDICLISRWENEKSSAGNVTLQCAIGSDFDWDQIKKQKPKNETVEFKRKEKSNMDSLKKSSKTKVKKISKNKRSDF